MIKGKNFSCNNSKGQRKKSDFYETPYSMTQQLLDVEKFYNCIFEPACGGGAIVKILEKNNFNVKASDLSMGVDFLKITNHVDQDIITNPPFSLAKEFILKAKSLKPNKIAMLLPLSYLHGVNRLKEIWSDKDFPLKCVYVFTRYPMLGDSLREDGKYRTGMMVYGWYVWDKSYKGEPMIRWINNQQYILNCGDIK